MVRPVGDRLAEHNADQVEHSDVSIDWIEYVTLSIYLRQRGSPESKPVGAAHTATGVEG